MVYLRRELKRMIVNKEIMQMEAPPAVILVNTLETLWITLFMQAPLYPITADPTSLIVFIPVFVQH